MKSDFLNKTQILVLNNLYQPVGQISLKKALVAMNSDGPEPSARAIDIIYGTNPDGSRNLEEVISFFPYLFEEWLMVEFREGLDNYIRTPRIKFRAPTVLITSYAKMPKKKLHANKSRLFEAQQGRCGYTGKIIPFKKGNIEHIKPRSLGGKDEWENLLYVDADVNHKRGNRPLEELGLKPLFKHKTPKPIPASCTIKKAVHPDWQVFLNL